ncbi:PIN domain-domain containing protein [Rhodotorula toruloides]|uniref:PIN domain-domain containing protein n=1 Tax=Rhodotorula toruloides TaxID=5286 RepID=A0A2T0AG01_RHOTO|nr:PIN domain-domain containing protein [Rhodotorula toruloides]PRQ76927.1 PIN domain-domain containing protein [Rhodotorula toruloides]
MEWDKVEVPDSATVLDALRHLRSEDGHAGMQIDMPWELDGSWAPEEGPVAVVDTNILVSHLALLREFVELAARLPPSSRPVLLIPHIVLLELDGLKTSSRSTDTYSNNGSSARARSSISTLARSATNWLLSELSGSRDNGVVRGQGKAETLLSLDERGKTFGENNDSLVLDAALYQREQRSAIRVLLLTDDRNLQLRATVEHIEAFGIEAGQDVTALLDRLSSPVPLPKPSHSPSPPPRPRQPSFSRHAGPSPVKTPRKRRSPPAPSPLYPSPSPSSSSFVPPSPAAPTQRREPPTSVPLPTYHAMEAEAIDTPPPHSDLPPPPLVSVESPVDVFYNLSLLIGHFVALPLYRHAYQYLRSTRPHEQHEWQPELGDWRYWSPAECAQRAKRWWEDGQVRELCRVGLEHASTTPLDPPAPPHAQPLPQRQPSSSGSSRWATPTPSAPSPPPTSTKQSLAAPRRPKPSIDRQLSDLYSSLPTLVTYLSSAPPSLTTWSAPRWEVLLESTGTFLVAVLGGAVGGDVRGEVGTVVREWVGDLGRLGIRVQVEL